LKLAEYLLWIFRVRRSGASFVSCEPCNGATYIRKFEPKRNR